MADLADAITRATRVEAKTLNGKQVQFTAYAGDTIHIWPLASEQSDSPVRLLWSQMTTEGITVAGGQLDWEGDIVGWALGKAYGMDQIAPEYAPVTAALWRRGLTTEIIPAPGGWLIAVPVSDGTQVVVGGDADTNDETTTSWHAQHRSDRPIAEIYRGAGVDDLANAIADYLSSTSVRYAGRHPLAPTVDGESASPDELYHWIDVIAQCTRTRESPDGCLITVADVDGSNAASILLPEEAMVRIIRIAAAEAVMLASQSNKR
jgi:hypothetical protein